MSSMVIHYHAFLVAFRFLNFKIKMIFFQLVSFNVKWLESFINCCRYYWTIPKDEENPLECWLTPNIS